MIDKLTTDEGANAFLVVVLSGTIAALAAKGPGRASLGRILSGVLSNPVPRTGKLDAGSPLTGASERRAAA
jgi:hypothetical protein